MTDIAQVLERLGLDQYLDAFLNEGFDTWETLLDIQERDLEALHVKLGHRRKLQRAIAEFRGWSTDHPLGSPAQDALSETSKVGDTQTNPATNRDLGQGQASETKRKYRRHPKPDDNAPEKPPSAYVIFSNKVREEVKGENLTFTEIARLVGERWQKLGPSQKEPFEVQAANMKENYNNQLVDYKKTAAYKDYSQYLSDFKAKHGQTGDYKRPKLDAQSSGGSLSAASGGDPGEVAAPAASHIRGGSVGSMSAASYGGALPSPGGVPPASVPSLPTPTAFGGKMLGTVFRSGSPTQAHLSQERRFLGQISSRSSQSEESSANRPEQHDPLSRASALSLSTPPSGTTPPLPISSSFPGRSDQPGSSDSFVWSQRHTAPGLSGPASMLSAVGTLGGASAFSGGYPGESWRDRNESGRTPYHAVSYKPPSHPGALPLPQLLATERGMDMSQMQTQRTLPPLRPPPSTGAISPRVQPRFSPPSLRTRQSGSSEAGQTLDHTGSSRVSSNQPEDEAANALAGLAGLSAHRSRGGPREHGT